MGAAASHASGSPAAGSPADGSAPSTGRVASRPSAPSGIVRPPPSRLFFSLLLLVAAAATGVLVWPIAPELLFGAVLAAAGAPLYERLAQRLRGHREIAAVVFTLLFVLLILVPVVIAVGSAARELVGAAQEVGARLNTSGLEGLLAPLPKTLRARLLQVQLDEAALQERIGELSGRAMAVARAALKATTDAAFSLAMVLIALVVFLVDGGRVVRWLDEVVPLGHGQIAELLREFRRMGVAVVVGNFGTSAVQSLVALVGYLIAGAPSPLLLTLATFLLSFVPTVGGAGTGLVVAAGLGLAGAPWRALFLAVWAVAVVGVVDNLVKPLLVKRGVKLHGALVFFAIIAGIVSFGPSGLLLGPMIVTFAVTLVRIYGRDFERSGSDSRVGRRGGAGSGGAVPSGGSTGSGAAVAR